MMKRALCTVCVFFVIMVFCLHDTYGRSVCYKPLGCFYPRNGWLGLWETLPDSPNDIQTVFTLYTNNHSKTMGATEPERFNFSTFDPEIRTVILLKGDPDYNPGNWADTKLEELRGKGDFNIILVDWNVKGANYWLYNTTVPNLRVVGAQIGRVLDNLRRVHNIDLDSIEFLGHSLQGHVTVYSLADIVDAGTINGYSPTMNAVSGKAAEDVVIVDIIEPGSSYGVCYDSLGCFPCRYSGEKLPEHPRRLNTRFEFYTSDNTTQVIQAVDIANEAFIPSGMVLYKRLKTVMVIHGLWEDGGSNNTWIGPMIYQLRKQKSVNIVVVDWEEGADSWYEEAIANARVVGTQIAMLLRVYGIDPGTVHIIGYSLGAHVAGYAGANIRGIGRITGLDPAGWWFETAHSFASLDSTDALFVDVIHTDTNSGYGFGIRRPIGTVDFYVNGGQDQPGCPKGSLLGRAIRVLNGHIVCSHTRSIELFMESININRCYFVGHPCEDIDNYDKCVTCDGGCAQMGFHSDIANVSVRSYHVTTLSQTPYCSIGEAKKWGFVSNSINGISP